MQDAPARNGNDGQTNRPDRESCDGNKGNEGKLASRDEIVTVAVGGQRDQNRNDNEGTDCGTDRDGKRSTRESRDIHPHSCSIAALKAFGRVAVQALRADHGR